MVQFFPQNVTDIISKALATKNHNTQYHQFLEFNGSFIGGIIFALKGITSMVPNSLPLYNNEERTLHGKMETFRQCINVNKKSFLSLSQKQ